MAMSELADLEHFYASFNSLSTPAGSTQPLAGRFCVRNATKLYSLILRANNFTGTVNMSHCEGLGLLDVQVCCVVAVAIRAGVVAGRAVGAVEHS
jgi:hypothetical protein